MSAPHAQVERADFDRYMVPNYAPAAFIPVRGEGSRVWDQSGRELIDFAGGIAVTSLGHAHPALVKALTEQAQRIWHVSNVFTNEPALRLARKLVDATFAERVFLANSGAEANEAAFKLARRYANDVYGPQKYEIIAASNSFHGRTLFTVNVGGQPKYSDGFGPKFEGITHVPYNDLEALKAAISDKTCAVVLEPIQGEGGVRPASQEFLQGLRDLCDEKGILLMFDEVQVGSGRTGKLFAHQNYGVEPDTCSMAKALGSGVPIGAVCARGDAAKTLTPGTHGSTFAGGPLACALAATTLDVMINEGVIENARVMGEYFRDQMHKVIEKNHPKAVNEIRGLGMINGIQLNHPSGQPVVDLCFQDNKVLINNTNGNVLRFVPPLITGKEEIDLCIKAVDDAMTKLGW